MEDALIPSLAEIHHTAALGIVLDVLGCLRMFAHVCANSRKC